jgi:ATP sulfurylase
MEMIYAAPIEPIFHAINLKNCGFDHIIIGREYT